MSHPIGRRNFLSRSAAGVVAALAAQPARAQAPRRLVMVHGRSQGGRDPADIEAEWLAALTEGAARAGVPLPPDVRAVFPFYGARLDELVELSKVEPAGKVTEKGSQAQDAYLQFQADLAIEMQQKLGVTEDEINAEYGDNPREKGPLNWEWVHAIVRAIDARSDTISAGALETFTRDVFLYLELDVVRDEVNEIVAAELTGEPTVVIIHSLGSVVSYNVLHNAGSALQVPLYVTVGSPLGIRAIRSRLSPISYPAGVGNWQNFYDDRDIVALNPLDAANFQVTPEVVNHGGIDNVTDNRHGISGYLNVAQVARPILGSMQ